MPDERRDITITNGVLRVCCAGHRNLRTYPSDPGRPGVTLRVCRVCGRRHIEMNAEAGEIGMRGSRIG